MSYRFRALVLVGLTVGALACAIALKRPCLPGTGPTQWVNNHQYSSLCYNDLQALYYTRHLDHNSGPRLPYVDEFVEYPTLIGMAMYLTARPSRSDTAFFWWNTVVLAACALGATVFLILATGARWRVLMFAAAPSLVLYAVHNWDLLAVAPLSAGLWLWQRRRFGWSGFAFGLGAAAKLFPAAALLAGAVALLRERRPQTAARFAGTGAAVVAVWNVPFAIANPSLWWKTWTFQGGRFPDFGTVWYQIWTAVGRPAMGAFQRLADRGGLVLLVAVVIAVMMLQWRRRLPMAPAAGVIVAAFLVASKVHSPQYALWMLPFLVVVPGSWPWFAGYEAFDLLLFVSGFRWIAEPTFQVAPSGWQRLFAVAVVGRAVALAAIALHFVRSAGSPSEALDGEGGRHVDVDAGRRFARLGP